MIMRFCFGQKKIVFFQIYSQHFDLEKRCTYRDTDRSGEVIVDTIGREQQLAAKPRT